MPKGPVFFLGFTIMMVIIITVVYHQFLRPSASQTCGGGGVSSCSFGYVCTQIDSSPGECQSLLQKYLPNLSN